jgi:hypothetical protein
MQLASKSVMLRCFSLIYVNCDKYTFQCQVIYIVDKTAVITVQKQTRIIGRKGVKQDER